MNIIKFDNEIFVNYSGLRSVNSEQIFETAFEEMLAENQLHNLGQGYVFIDKKVHVHHQFWRFIRLGLVEWSNPFSYFIRARHYQFRLAQTEFHFRGFFRILNLRGLAADYQKPGFWLTASEHSYVNGMKLKSGCDFRLFEENVDQSCGDSAFFLKNKNELKKSSNKHPLEGVYFCLSDLAMRATGSNLDNKDIAPDIEFEKWQQNTKLNYEHQRSPIKDVEIAKDNSTSGVSEQSDEPSTTESIIISALFHALELENPAKYNGPDARVFNRLTELFPDQRGLGAGTIEKRLAVGRKPLGISKKTVRKERLE